MEVTKDGVTYPLTDETQLEAFLNSGWELVEESKAPRKPAKDPEQSKK